VPLGILIEKKREAVQRNKADIMSFSIRSSFFNEEPVKFPDEVVF
jgi:hypothetical protein